MNPCELRWLASVPASCIHAADALLRGGKLVVPRLAKVLALPAQSLRDEIRVAGLPEDRIWRALNTWSYQCGSNRELALMVLRKTVGRAPNDSLAIRLAGRLGELENAVRQTLPRLADDLALRARPLRELWEACGPGLLNSVARLTDERVLVENADVVLVHPALGGGGAAHLANNSVRFEAVLTNNVPQLPEVVRLGWLLAQLNQDLPLFSEQIHAGRVPLVASLALLPATLQAASELELCRFDRPLLNLALSAWRLEVPQEPAAEIVSLFWTTYQASPIPWAAALSALDQMLAPILPQGRPG